mmetsp:Transcript_23560/g.73942  ORF Transcript_23560/g.73942 Transcript_23560/m.73942 type:complete len:259 (-) Transcript_23560:266-1042(-)
MHVLHDAQVLLRRAHVLSQGDDVDAVAAQVLHALHDLLPRLAEAEHDARLGVHLRVGLLGALKYRHALGVVRARVAHVALQPLHRLDVVRVDVEARVREAVDGGEVAPKVAHEALHEHAGLPQLDELDGAREVVRAAVGHVVAVDAREHHVLDTPARDGFRRVERLGVIRRRRRLRRFHGAEAAAPGARVAEQHDGSRAAVPALADVRALRLLADRREPQLPHRGLELPKRRVVAARRGHAEPIRPLRRHRRPHAREN